MEEDRARPAGLDLGGQSRGPGLIYATSPPKTSYPAGGELLSSGQNEPEDRRETPSLKNIRRMNGGRLPILSAMWPGLLFPAVPGFPLLRAPVSVRPSNVPRPRIETFMTARLPGNGQRVY